MAGEIKCWSRECNDYNPEYSTNCGKPLQRIQECKKAVLKKEIRSGNWYLDELMSNECACGNNKKKGHSFCYGCYKVLPGDLKSEIYRKIGQGYEEIYDECFSFLVANGRT